MEYIRLLSNLSEHPKWLRTSHTGRSVLIALWCYCGRNETAGEIPAPAARREGLTDRMAHQLEALGWIHRNGAGWHVHDWEDHQVDAQGLREERERRRRYEAERKRAYRRAKAMT